jgi:hypothetical protein
MQMEINETWFQLFNDAGLRLSESMRVDEAGAHRFAELLEALARFIRWHLCLVKRIGESERCITGQGT